ncbi:MAG: autotransporter outer membrane beta-barrel domain-containing protein [Alphaproteobacteria bacterium]|nr:autotransporter outer membrane beta-barrel domain-containing protein [Alphaproteobacteria bacterium]
MFPLLSESNTQGFLLDLDALLRGGERTSSTQHSPWNFWLQGSLTVFDDDQAADRDGQFLQFIGGTSYRVNPRLTVGGLVTYNNGSTTSNALASSLSSNFLGAGLFARVDVYEGVLLDTVINYQHGWNDVTISGASGDFGSDSIDIAAGLSKRVYFRPDWWLEPNASLSYSNIRRSAYTNSSGAAIASSNVEQGRFTFGPKIGHIFAPASGPLTQGEVFVGLNAIVDFISNGDSNVGNGLVANDPDSGVQVSGGLNMTFDNGWDASASGTYMSVGTLDSFTASINLRIPLN